MAHEIGLPKRMFVGALFLSVALLPAAGGLTCGAGRNTPPPPAIPPGDYDRTLDHGGLTRTYKLHVPPQHDGQRSLPLVLMFHGGFGTAENASLHYGWSEKADAEGFVAAYPDGTGDVQTWNANHCCGVPRLRNTDDVGFAAALIAELKRLLVIDTQRIYATGMSNGGMFVHRLGAERPDLIAAIAPVAATIGGQFRSDRPVERPPAPAGSMPIIMVHGTTDDNVKYDGGESASVVSLGRIDLSVVESSAFWIGANNCDPAATRTVSASGNVIHETWHHRGNLADVELYSVVGQGHAWPGGLLPRLGADPPSTELDATDVIWSFFSSHPRQ